MKIAFCGTVSVGKTTLVRRLAELPEFKHYKIFTERSKYLRDLGIPLNTESTYKGQLIFMAERASELINDDFLADRTVLDVMAFSMTSDEIIHDNAKLTSLQYITSSLEKEYDCIIYVPITIGVEDNGIRTTDEKYRNEIDRKIQKLFMYSQCKDKYMVQSKGTVEEKVAEIMGFIKNKMEKVRE